MQARLVFYNLVYARKGIRFGVRKEGFKCRDSLLTSWTSQKAYIAFLACLPPKWVLVQEDDVHDNSLKTTE